MTATHSTSQSVRPASALRPGDVILKAGTTTHSPITVTRVTPHTLPGFLVVEGFNSRDTTPRLMFRSLQADLPITLAPSTGLFRVAFGAVTYADGRTASNVALTVDARDADAAALRAMDLIVTDHKAVRPSVESITPVDAHPLPGVGPVAVKPDRVRHSSIIGSAFVDVHGVRRFCYQLCRPTEKTGRLEAVAIVNITTQGGSTSWTFAAIPSLQRREHAIVRLARRNMDQSTPVRFGR